ncbi:hypothetical protein HYDPIDRAFT_118256, partial [Hydnomerulius pinastri MD-312]
MMWLVTAAEATVILKRYIPLSQCPTNLVTTLDTLGPVDSSNLTPAFVVGSLLFIMAGTIRLQCYRALGRFFTFKLCVRKEHQLVTAGPYSIVRHPGYTGTLICVVGAYAMHGTPGSWLRLSGVLDISWVRGLAIAWCMITTVVSVTLLERTSGEDKILAEKFGREWENWASRVRYRLIPGVY